MNEPLPWAQETFAVLNLTWAILKPIAKHPKDAHIQGLTADKAAGIDLVLTPTAIRTATIITPINAAYMPIPVFVIAAMANVEQREADQWLAKLIQQLNRQRRKEAQATIKQLRGVASITTVGVFTLVLTGR